MACLAGDGVGPELMGEACASWPRSRACTRCGSTTPPALRRRGAHPRRPSAAALTREAYRSADAVLVCSPDEPALDGVKTDLDLAWRVSRVHNEARGDLVVVEPVGYGTRRARDRPRLPLAAARRARLTSVGSTPEWSGIGRLRGRRWDGLAVEHLTLGGC